MASSKIVGNVKLPKELMVDIESQAQPRKSPGFTEMQREAAIRCRERGLSIAKTTQLLRKHCGFQREEGACRMYLMRLDDNEGGSL